MHGGCHCCHSETVSFVVSLLSRDVPCECSISECLAIVPLTRHQFRTKSGQFNGCLHACLHENILACENAEKRRAYSSAFSSKMWYSRVICVFLRWGLTYIWHVLWGKLYFNFEMYYFITWLIFFTECWSNWLFWVQVHAPFVFVRHFLLLMLHCSSTQQNVIALEDVLSVEESTIKGYKSITLKMKAGKPCILRAEVGPKQDY